MNAKIVCGAMAAALAMAGRARADDCGAMSKDDASWVSKVVVRGAMAVIDCDTCSAGPVRIKKVEVKKAAGDPGQREIWIDGRAVDLSTVFVQTGAETFTSVGALVGCVAPSDAIVRHVSKADATTGIPECDRYIAAIERYGACSKVPQQARDAVKQSVDQMKQAWGMMRDPNVPAEAKKAAADACMQATDAIKQSGVAMGCPM